MEVVHPSAAELADEAGRRVVRFLWKEETLGNSVLIHANVDWVLRERSRQRVLRDPLLGNFARRNTPLGNVDRTPLKPQTESMRCIRMHQAAFRRGQVFLVSFCGESESCVQERRVVIGDGGQPGSTCAEIGGDFCLYRAAVEFEAAGGFFVASGLPVD